MPVARPGPPDSSSDGTIRYQTDVIRQVAGQIIARVSLTQETHTTTWNSIQTYLDGDTKWQALPPSLSQGHIQTLNGSMPDVYYYLRNVLEPHVKRLQASFDLQLQVAQALFDLADQIDEAEQEIANGFRPSETPSTPPGKGHGFVP